MRRVQRHGEWGIAAWLLLVLAMPTPLHAEHANGLGMWVWSGSAYSTEEGRQRLVRFCLRHRINHLDVHIKMSHENGASSLRDAEAFRELILLTGHHNITTAALRGDPRMFFLKNHGRAQGELGAIIAFSQTLPKDALFKGIKYDVEPYGTEEWREKGEAREAVMRDYLTFLRKARSVLQRDAPRLWLSVDTPFWWDDDQFMLEFEGQKKRFSEHVQDLTDYIAIMSYRRDPQEVLACVDSERKYARRIQKVIFPSLETVDLKKTPQLSFWGVPTEEFWKVVPFLLEKAKDDPGMGGVMIHCYHSLAEKIARDNSDQPEPREDR